MIGTMPSRRAAVVPSVDPKLFSRTVSPSSRRKSTPFGQPNGRVNHCRNYDANFNVVE